MPEKETLVTRTADRPFDWVAALAVASGAAVMIPSLLVLGVNVLAVLAELF